MRLYCEGCDVWADTPTEWGRHPNGLGGHIISTWLPPRDLDLEIKLRNAADDLADGHIAPEYIGYVLDKIIEEHHAAAAVETSEA